MKFDVLIVDPPWSYNNKKTGGSHKSGSAQKYKTMNYLDIISLNDQLYHLMNKDSCLFLWSTNSMLKEALFIMDEWDYNFKTMLTWNKERYGMGFWFRGQTEHCLFGTKGNIPAFKSRFRNIMTEQSTKHSKKPDMFYHIIDETFKGKNILELFATRERYANWKCLGNEISGKDIVTDLEELGRKMTEDQIKEERVLARGGSKVFR